MRNKIRELRGDMSQDHLATRIGVTRQTVNAIETGRFNPSLPLAFAIARFFGKQIEDVFLYCDAQHPATTDANH